MRRLGEVASDVARGWYSPKSTILRREVSGSWVGGTEREGVCSHSREKLNAELILLAIQPLILSLSLLSLSAFILFRASLFHRSFRTDKRTPFFPVISANRGIGSPSNGYSVPPVFASFFSLPFLRFPLFLPAFASSLRGTSPSYSFSFIGTAFINIQWPATSLATAKLPDDFACAKKDFAPLSWI